MTLRSTSTGFGLEEKLWERIRSEIEELAGMGCYERVSEAISLYMASKLRLMAAALLGIGRKPPKRIVDVGCGPGTSTVILRSLYPEAEIIAIDPAVGNVLHTKSRVASPSACVLGVFESIPLQDSSVDGVIAMFSFRDVTNYLRALDEAKRVLKPDGRLVILDLYRPERPLESILTAVQFRVFAPTVGLAMGCGRMGLRFADIYPTVLHMLTPSQLVEEARKRFHKAAFFRTPTVVGVLLAEGPRP